MRFSRLPVLFALCISSAAVGSEPGQPLDCSDWVVQMPGIGCRTVLPYPCNYGGPGGDTWCGGTANNPIDNEGSLIAVAVVNVAQVLCGSYETYLQRSEIRRFNGVTEEVIAYLPERCGIDSTKDRGGVATKTFDEQAGYLYLTGTSTASGIGPSPYSPGSWLIRFEGFTTESQVLQSFHPASDFSFRVPVRPEDLAGVDYFDTYWGDLGTVGDWSQARGIQCSYPATPPSVGDYLEITDTLPTPGPGQGYYYVTAATYQGQTRYGRQTTNGVVTGRNPAVLPACTTK